MKIYFYILIGFFIFSEKIQAHQKPGDMGHSLKSQTNQDAEVQAIIQLTRVLHHAIEGDAIHIRSVKDFFQAFRNKEQWAELLNFYKITGRTVRAFNLESNKHLMKNHAKNLALLFPVSHFIEVATAPAFVALGTVHEFPGIVIGFGGSVLSLIAVPGLDPLCILLLLTYPLKPVHKSIDFLRSATEKGLRGMMTVMRLDALLSRADEDRFAFIQHRLNSRDKFNQLWNVEFIPSKEESRLSLFDRKSEEKILSLERVWDPEESRFYIKSIWISRQAQGAMLKKNFLKLISWNARMALREVLKLLKNPQKIQSYRREFFVDQVMVNENEMEVIYKDKAIYLSRIRFKNILKSVRASCKNTFLY